MIDQSGGGSPQGECRCSQITIQSTDTVCPIHGDLRPRSAALAARAGGIDALTLEAARAQLLVAEGLLLRCESNLPPHLVALLADVRTFLGIDPRGFRSEADR